MQLLESWGRVEPRQVRWLKYTCEQQAEQRVGFAGGRRYRREDHIFT